MSAVPAPVSITGFDAARFAAHLSSRGSLPGWWLETKKAAWNQFLALPMPPRTDERWRFSNISGLTIDGFTVPDEPASSIPPLPRFSRAAEIIFSNRKLASRTSLPKELSAKGVIFCPLEEALSQYGDLVRAHLQKHPAALGAEKFVALNTAFTASGAFLYVPKGVEITEVLAVQHTLSGADHAIFPHTIVALEDNARATLVEFFISSEATGRQFASGVNDLYAGAGAQLTYVGAQAWTHETLAFQTNSIVAQRDARVLSLNIHLGGRQARHESHSRLQGPGAHSEMLALTVADGQQEFDQRTLQTHQAPHTSSNLLYKNALLDKAKTIFSGLIVVEPDAQKTDAYQSNRNLMLSDEAEANSLPGLEIQANDVRCTHGATTSRVPAEQEFYLKSRGIRPEQAHELLIFGFFEEVLSKLENDSLHEALRGLIQAKVRR
ncbi:Fe-S cluster assembly protein SufD [Opitutaceae bacterium EW11]|nr:Fe-S cluster assembly protein SufD [Opitutaceae bacterium EW11]